MSKSKVEPITLNGIKYFPEGAELTPAQSLDGLKYVIIRTTSAGVFAGYLKKKTGQNVILLNARRLWYWAGAASLSQVAVDGVKKPDECKFPCEVPEIELDQVIETTPATEKARLSLTSVPVWEQ